METIGADLREMQRTPLAASHVDALRAAGGGGELPRRRVSGAAGRPGRTDSPMSKDGEIEVVNP